MPLFDRVCKFVVGTGGGSTEDEFLVFDQNFRLTFDITINPVGANQCTAQIYNLSEESLAKVKNIVKENEERYKKQLPQLILLIFAGYAEGDGLEFLYSANITHTNTIYQAPDYITTISAYGGAIPFKNVFMQVAYQAGIDSVTILKQIAKELEMTVDSSTDFGTAINFNNGVTISGQAKEALDNIAGLAGLHWTLTANNTLRFSPIGLSSDDTVLFLSPDSGIINPIRDMDEAGFQLLDIGLLNGYEVDILLEPKALTQRRVQIESKTVNGEFFIQSVEHKGDTRGNNWMTVLQVKEEVIQ